MSSTPRPRPHPDLELRARYVMLTSLAENRRVLDFAGEAKSLLILAEAGATELTAVADDPEQLRATLAAAGVEGVDVVPTPGLPLPFADQSFDLVFFHDLAEHLATDLAWIGELRRVIAPDGYLVLALANPEGRRLSDLCRQSYSSALSYQDAFAQLSPAFGVLTVLVQSPLAANLFYDLESTEEDPGLVYDRSLLGDDPDEPGWYLLIFGPTPVHRDDLSIIQTPFASLAQAVLGRDADETLAVAAATIEDADFVHLRQEKDELAKRVLGLQAELSRVQNDLRTREEPLRVVQQALFEREEQLRLAQQELAGREEQLRVVQQELAGREEQLRVVQQELSDREAAQPEADVEMLRQRIEALKHEREVGLDKLALLRERHIAAEDAREEATGKLALQEQRLAALEGERQSTEDELKRVRARIVELEEQAPPTAAGATDPDVVDERLKALKADRDRSDAKRGELSTQLQQLEAERDLASRELGSLRERLEALARERHEEQEALAASRAQLTSAEAERDEARREVELLRTQLETVKQECSDGQAALAASRAQLMSAEAERDEARREVELLRPQLEAVKQECSDGQAALAASRAQLASGEAERDEARREVELLRAQLEALKKEHDDGQEQITLLRAQAETAQAARSQDEGACQQLSAKVRGLEEELLQKGRELDAAAAELLVLRQRVQALDAERDGEQQQMQALQHRLEEQQAGAASAAGQVSLLEERIESLKAGRSDDTAKLNLLRQRLLDAEKNEATLGAAFAGLREEHERVVVELAALGDEHAKATQQVQEQLDQQGELVAGSEQRAAVAAARVVELEGEIQRQARDRQSFESQIKDLLEEVSGLRDAAESHRLLEEELRVCTTERDALSETARLEKRRGEGLREDLARLHAKLGNVEAENTGLANEVQRLTDALHDAQVGQPQVPAGAPMDVHDADTVVMASPLTNEQTTPVVGATPESPAGRRDAVGRPLEASLEDIEDLIAGSVPTPPSRRQP